MSKSITPIFEQRGKRRKLIGFRASYDGFEIGVYDTHRDAEAALRGYGYEEAGKAR